VPAESNQPYDIKDVIHRIVDRGDFFEVQNTGRNIVVGFACGRRSLALSPISRYFSPMPRYRFLH
jgi:hypothetical protein